eukprot:IDg5864t1
MVAYASREMERTVSKSSRASEEPRGRELYISVSTSNGSALHVNSTIGRAECFYTAQKTAIGLAKKFAAVCSLMCIREVEFPGFVAMWACVVAILAAAPQELQGVVNGYSVRFPCAPVMFVLLCVWSLLAFYTCVICFRGARWLEATSWLLRFDFYRPCLRGDVGACAADASRGLSVE